MTDLQARRVLAVARADFHCTYGDDIDFDADEFLRQQYINDAKKLLAAADSVQADWCIPWGEPAGTPENDQRLKPPTPSSVQAPIERQPYKPDMTCQACGQMLGFHRCTAPAPNVIAAQTIKEMRDEK